MPNPSGTIGEVKDIIREHFSRTQFPTGQLDLAIAEGRRGVENYANFWWMRTRKDFSLTVDQGQYSILTSASNGLNIPLFKDAIAFTFTTTVSGTVYEPLTVGEVEREEAEVMYASGEDGAPETIVIEGDTLYVFPEDPQVAYPCRLYYWTYTENPDLNSESDVLTLRFPMALVYASLKWGYEMILKDLQGAAYWRDLLEGRGGIIHKLKRENFKRGMQDHLTFVPHVGASIRGRRRLDNIQIYR